MTISKANDSPDVISPLDGKRFKRRATKQSPIQFSLSEMLFLVMSIGSLLTVKHAPADSAADWHGDLSWIGTCFVGWAIGVVWTSRRNETGWRRRVRVSMVTGLFVLGSLVSSGTVYHNCWRCGAVKAEYYGLFSTIDEWKISQRIARLSGKKCTHCHWKFQTSYSLWSIEDGFPSFTVPVLMDFNEDEYGVVKCLEKIPIDEWRRTIIDLIGDRDNRLKYAATMAVMDLSEKCPTTDQEWLQWWTANQPIFQRETSAARAAPIAQAAVNRAWTSYSCSIGLSKVGTRIRGDAPAVRLP